MEAPERRFVVDSMLGKVAKWLRILGFDTRYERLESGARIDQYASEGWLLITRNRRWCGRSRVLCIKANDSMEQLAEVIEAASIRCEEIRPLHRCVRCNRPLEAISRDLAVGVVPDYVFETNTIFHRCPDCRRVYWPGTHPRRMMEQLRRAVGWSI
jgi:hypothetical protein